MYKFSSRLFAILLCAALLSACASQPPRPAKLKPDAYYWQRVDAASSALMQGPKAQQMLERDMANCALEIRELEKLAAIRHIPPKQRKYERRPTRKQSEIARTADKTHTDPVVRAPYLPYHDFQACMNYKGWELLEEDKYEIAEEDAQDYADRIINESYQSRIIGREPVAQSAEPLIRRGQPHSPLNQ